MQQSWFTVNQHKTGIGMNDKKHTDKQMKKNVKGINTNTQTDRQWLLSTIPAQKIRERVKKSFANTCPSLSLSLSLSISLSLSLSRDKDWREVQDWVKVSWGGGGVTKFERGWVLERMSEIKWHQYLNKNHWEKKEFDREKLQKSGIHYL